MKKMLKIMLSSFFFFLKENFQWKILHWISLDFDDSYQTELRIHTPAWSTKILFSKRRKWMQWNPQWSIILFQFHLWVDHLWLFYFVVVYPCFTDKVSDLFMKISKKKETYLPDNQKIRHFFWEKKGDQSEKTGDLKMFNRPCHIDICCCA